MIGMRGVGVRLYAGARVFLPDLSLTLLLAWNNWIAYFLYHTSTVNFISLYFKQLQDNFIHITALWKLPCFREQSLEYS
jgi:hypothetical protein